MNQNDICSNQLCHKTLTDLPVELLGIIFQYLSVDQIKQISQICKVFYNATKSYTKWPCIVLFVKRLKPNALNYILTRNIRRLDLAMLKYQIRHLIRTKN